jgi:hypothetical protein
MVDGEREIAHRADADRLGALRFDHAYAPLDLAHAENGHLGLVDHDRGCEKAASNAMVRESERAAANLLGRELPGASGGHELAETARDLGELQPLGAVDHRHDQTLVAERRTHADVGIRMQLERVLVEGRIHRGVSEEGPGARRDEIGGVGEP